MTTKLGRPKLPSGESKDIQIGVRFKPKENEAIETSAEKEKQDKVKWLRQAALEATKEWIKCEEWTPEELQGKRVRFELVTILEGPIRGTGKFDVWKRGDGFCKIRIVSYADSSTPYAIDELRVYVPQKGVKLIKKLPDGSDCDFSLMDPLFQKYHKGQA